MANPNLTARAPADASWRLSRLRPSAPTCCTTSHSHDERGMRHGGGKRGEGGDRLMPRPATGSIRERKSKSGAITYALRFRAYGKREDVTLGTKAEGWTRDKAETELRQSSQTLSGAFGSHQDPNPLRPRRSSRPSMSLEANGSGPKKAAGGRAPPTITDGLLQQQLLPFFKDHRLSEITAEEIDRYTTAKQREGRITNNSINKTLTRLAQILEVAVDYEKIDRNPAKSRKRRLKGEARSRPWVAPEQLMSLLGGCGGELRPLVATLAGAGLRISEAIALRWRHINLATGTITVEDSKTAAGVRDRAAPRTGRRTSHPQIAGPQDREERSGLPHEVGEAPKRPQRSGPVEGRDPQGQQAA